MLSRRLLPGFVGLPSEGTIQLKILGFEPRVLGDTSEHLRPYRCIRFSGCAVATLGPFRDRYNIFGFTFCVRHPVIRVFL